MLAKYGREAPPAMDVVLPGNKKATPITSSPRTRSPVERQLRAQCLSKVPLCRVLITNSSSVRPRTCRGGERNSLNSRAALPFTLAVSLSLAGIEDLCAKRDELHQQILQDEEEKQRVQHDLRILTERLTEINDSLARKIAMRNDYDRTISETESAYRKVCVCVCVRGEPF